MGLIVAGTGHRPPKLGLGYDRESNQVLRKFVVDQLKKLAADRPIDLVLSGMSTGYDLALAEAARALVIPYVAVCPFRGMDDKWPADGRMRFDLAIHHAKEVVYVSEGGYANHKYLKRDHYLVDHSTLLLALYDEQESKGGTAYTMAYALRQNREIINLWPEWVKRSV